MDDQHAFMVTARESYKCKTAASLSSRTAAATGRGLQIVHFDNWRSSAWDVITHGGFLTYPHHDSVGQMVYAYIRTGAKLWGYLKQAEVDHSDQDAVLKVWSGYYSAPMAADTYNKGVKLGMVLLEPESVL